MKNNSNQPPLGSPSSLLPLLVDMDAALLRADIAAETFVAALFHEPLSTLGALRHLFCGEMKFRRRLNEIVEVDLARLPLREELILYLQSEQSRGRTIHLVTSASQQTAEQVTSRAGISAKAHSSDVIEALSTHQKEHYLRQEFPKGFVYVGSALADVSLSSAATGVVVVDEKKRRRAVSTQCIPPVERELPVPAVGLSDWAKALRVEQWAKNVLIFVPLLLSQKFLDPAELMRTILAFFLFSLVASASYLINDLADLNADRIHSTKKFRPLASGALPLMSGLTVAITLMLLSLTFSVALAPEFGAVLTAYVVVTILYSLYLKRIPFFDVFVLGALYTSRLLAGIAVIQTAITPWILVFSMMFFFSLSLAKRQVEVRSIEGAIARRGYRSEDAPLTLAFGVASALASVLILVLYLVEEAFPSGIYVTPAWLWMAPAIVALWVMRIWLLAHRGELYVDPVSFAVRDKVSLGLGALLGLSFLLAMFL